MKLEHWSMGGTRGWHITEGQAHYFLALLEDSMGSFLFMIRDCRLVMT